MSASGTYNYWPKVNHPDKIYIQMESGGSQKPFFFGGSQIPLALGINGSGISMKGQGGCQSNERQVLTNDDIRAIIRNMNHNRVIPVDDNYIRHQIERIENVTPREYRIALANIMNDNRTSDANAVRLDTFSQLPFGVPLYEEDTSGSGISGPDPRPMYKVSPIREEDDLIRMQRGRTRTYGKGLDHNTLSLSDHTDKIYIPRHLSSLHK